MPTVKDVSYLDVAGATQSLSDLGIGDYPNIQIRDTYVILMSGATTKVIVPNSRVLLITLTDT